MRVSRLIASLYVSTVVLLCQAERQARRVEVPTQQMAVTRSGASRDPAGLSQPCVYLHVNRLANMLP